MAKDEDLTRIQHGVAAWNDWRAQNPECRVDLSGANLSPPNPGWMDLSRVNLSGADLSGADFSRTDFSWANLSQAFLYKANLSQAFLYKANLSGANLSGASLEGAILIEADLAKANLTGCRIYGISAWNVKLEGTKQRDLVITTPNEPEITIDNLEVAQFVYLLLHNEKIRGVIDTITSKAVLILGRFTPPERKQVLDALRKELRQRDYLPVVFDFEKPASQTTDETITLLARMARFVIADISDAKSVLQELRGIVPDLPTVAVKPLILSSQQEPGMFDFFHRYPWVLETHFYDNQERLIADLSEQVIRPAEAKVLELRRPSAVAAPVA